MASHVLGAWVFNSIAQHEGVSVEWVAVLGNLKMGEYESKVTSCDHQDGKYPG